MDKILTFSLIFLLRFVTFLPFHLQLKTGKWLGLLLYKMATQRQHIAKVNVSLCFPNLGPAAQESLIQEIFINNGIGMIEAAMSWWSNPESFLPRTTLVGRQHLDEALAKGRGVLLLGAHYSTLDLGGLLFSRFYPLNCMYRPHKNSVLEREIRKGRLRYLDSLIEKSDFRTVLKKLRNNKIVWYSPDQDMGSQNSVFASFFGVPAATTTATARLVKISGASVVLISHHRTAEGNYIVRLHPELKNFPKNNELDSATQVNQELEKGIQYDVSQYMWVHRRFKTTPDGKDFYRQDQKELKIL